MEPLIVPRQTPLRATHAPNTFKTPYPTSSSMDYVLLCFTEFSKQLGAEEESCPGPQLYHGEIWD